MLLKMFWEWGEVVAAIVFMCFFQILFKGFMVFLFCFFCFLFIPRSFLFLGDVKS